MSESGLEFRRFAEKKGEREREKALKKTSPTSKTRELEKPTQQHKKLNLLLPSLSLSLPKTPTI